MNWRTTITAPAPPALLELKNPAYLGRGTKVSMLISTKSVTFSRCAKSLSRKVGLKKPNKTVGKIFCDLKKRERDSKPIYQSSPVPFLSN